MKIKSFTVKQLKQNLDLNKSRLNLKANQMTIQFGENCKLVPLLGHFYVNQLPAIHITNPHLKFFTTESSESCLFVDDLKISLNDCFTPQDILNKLVSLYFCLYSI